MQVHGESLIHFEPIAFSSIPKTNWVFFSSQNAVQFFKQGIQMFGISISLKKLKLAGIGEGTSKVIEKSFGKCDFRGDGHPENVAKSFLKVAKNQKVLFPIAKNSRRSIQKIIKNQIEAIDLIVYENQPRKKFELPDFDILVFTSPLNVKAYFSKKQLHSYQKIVVIGETTAKAINELGISEYKIAHKPSEDILADTVISTLP